MAEVNVVKQPKERTMVPARTYERSPLAPFFEGNLFNINPFALMRRFTEDMDQMLTPVAKESFQFAEWRPAVEVKEEKGRIAVKADLPGVAMKDVKVAVSDGTLTIEGERKQETEEKREGYYHSERSYGKFFRSIQLPEGAKAEEATAQFNNGVLEITVPVQEAQQKRQEIPIQEGAKPQEAQKTKSTAT